MPMDVNCNHQVPLSKGTTGDDVEQVMICVEDVRPLANKIIGRVREPRIQKTCFEEDQQTTPWCDRLGQE